MNKKNRLFANEESVPDSKQTEVASSTLGELRATTSLAASVLFTLNFTSVAGKKILLAENRLAFSPAETRVYLLWFAAPENSDFINGTVYGKNDTWNVYPEVGYTIKLSFAERGSIQFPQGGDTIYFDLPQGLTIVENDHRTFTIPAGLIFGSAISGTYIRLMEQLIQ